ncbi:MAG: M23 family metallopeptidase [Rikenellaceae bacterium]
MIGIKIKITAIGVAALFMTSCSSQINRQQSEDIAYTTEQLIDSLQRADIVRLHHLPIISEADMPIVETGEQPDHEPIFFTSEQSAKVQLAEYKSLLQEDLEFQYVDLSKEFRFPLDSGYVTSHYGWRRGRMHAGIDIKAHKGDNIYAVFDGVVRMSKYYTAFGNCVVIRHYNGFETLYAHASQLLVKVNDVVRAGDVIALAGRTGRASGDHLHFELRYMGQYMNPALLLDVENLAMQQKNIYLSMRSGRLFASNSDSKEIREEEIAEATRIKYHTVRSGDTLSRIAQKNSTTVATLCRVNNISSTSILRLGQRIRVR